MGRLPNKHFRGASGDAKMASVSTLALLAVSAGSGNWREKGRQRVLSRIRPFTVVFDRFCGTLYDGKLSIIHAVKHGIDVFPPFALLGLCVWIEKLIHGNVQQGDELIKGIEAGVLAPVFNIHDGTRGTVYKLGQVFLCPAFGLPFPLDLPSEGVKIKVLVVLVHSHITRILFYISGAVMRTKHDFMFR